MTILLIGAPGSGKTWVMNELLNLLNVKKAKLGLFRFMIDSEKKIAVMGVYNGEMFEGSDKLSMGCMKDCDLLIQSKIKNELTIVCEGDRFTNKTFINKFNPIIIKIIDDGSWGRELRNSHQTQRQIKSIITRVENIKASHEVMTSGESLQLIKNILKL